MLRVYGDFARSGLGVFSVMADGIHQGFVGHHEEYGRIFGSVFMSMKVPKRHDERIALFPFITLVTNVAHTAAAPNMIDRGTGMAVAFGFFAAAKHMDLASHGGQG